MSSKALHYTAFAAILLAIVLICGCTQSTSSGDKTDMDIANNTAELVLQSLNNGSYSCFIYNSNASVISQVNESTFDTFRNAMVSQYGNYTSKSGPQYTTLKGYSVYVYNCTFEKSTLKLILSMNLANSSQVEGIRFT